MITIVSSGNREIFRFILLPERQLYIGRFTGVIGIEDVFKVSHAMWAHPDWNNKFQGVFDLRVCELRIRLLDMPKLLAFFLDFRHLVTKKTALIVSKPGNTAIALLGQSQFASVVGITIFSMPINAMERFNLSEAELNLLESEIELPLSG